MVLYSLAGLLQSSGYMVGITYSVNSCDSLGMFALLLLLMANNRTNRIIESGLDLRKIIEMAVYKENRLCKNSKFI